MAKADSTYQNTRVQIPQGGDRISIDDDGLFDFFGNTVTGDAAKKVLRDNPACVVVTTAGAILSSPNLPQNGLVILQLSVGCSNASAWLPACSVGDKLRIVLRNYLLESLLSVRISTSGCTIVGLTLSGVSRIGLHTSADSAGWIDLACVTAGVWSVVGGDSRKFAEISSS